MPSTATHSEPTRSPSSPPAPPIPLTPGPRAAALQQLYTNTLAHTLKTISYENFAACFPNIAAQVPGSLAIMHGEMISRLRKFATDEFNIILQERNVIPSLNALEELLSAARRRKSSSFTDLNLNTNSNTPNQEQEPPIPPHTLPPTTILTAHITPHLVSQQSTLNAKLQTVQSQNATLFQTMKQQEKEIEALLRGLETAVGDLDGAVVELDGEEGVDEEMRAWDGELKGV